MPGPCSNLLNKKKVEMDGACGMYGGEMIHGFGEKSPMERKNLETLATDETLTLDRVVKKVWAGVIGLKTD
jgi:hypothetical protein